MHTLTIVSENGKKGRSFQAELLAWIDAPSMFTLGAGADYKNHRPIWIAFAASEQASRMFTANLLKGRVATLDSGRYSSRRSGETFTILKSAGYQHHTRKIAGGVVTTVYIPDLFAVDPGMVDPLLIRFVLLSSARWRAAQTFDLADAMRFATDRGVTFRTDDYRRSERALTADDLRVLVPEAMLFRAYLDRRSRFPMPPHPHFALQLLTRALNEGFARRSVGVYGRQTGYTENGFDALNIAPGLGFEIDHESFGRLLAEEVQKWHA